MAIGATFSQCEVCNANLDNIKMYAPLYCISCIEEMEKLRLSPTQFKKSKACGKSPR